MSTEPTAVRRRESYYDCWVQAQGVPVIEGHYIANLREAKLDPWERVGALGAIVQHDGTQHSNDCHLIELYPGGSTTPEHHLAEETVFVLTGRGATEIWRDGEQHHSFEWQAGSLFAVPMNVWHQHHNGSGDQPARLICVTSLPAVLNLFKSEDFVFNCSHQFSDRYSGDADYFSGKGELDGMVWSTNFVSDVYTFQLLDYKARGAGGKNVKFSLAASAMGSHISEFPVGTYKKGHRHGPGAHVIILSGAGYSLMWNEGEPIKKFDWQPGTLVIPPDRMFHQHFNSGTKPARYLALRFTGNKPKGKGHELQKSSISVKFGGDQVEYEDESPEVRRIFAEALAKSGAVSKMAPFYSGELDGSDSD